MLSSPRAWAAAVTACVLIALLVISSGARLFTDYLWFQELGDVQVFRRTLAVKIELFAWAGGAAAVCFLVTLAFAVRHAPSRAGLDAVLAGTVGCLVAAGLIGRHAMGEWQTVMLWMHRSDFGVLDPVHHRDVSFFVFALPLAMVGANLLLTVLIVSLLITVAVHASAGGLSLRPLRTTRAFRVQIAVLAALGFVGGAWRLSLHRYSLEISDTAATAVGPTAVPGADYADAHVWMPVLVVLACVMLLFAPGIVVAAWRIEGGRHGHAHVGHRRLAHSAGRVLVAAVCAVSAVVWVTPTLVQQLVVDPQPVARERPFLNGAVSATRFAFSLEHVRVSKPPRPAVIEPTDAKRIAQRLGRVQVWDSSVVTGYMNGLTSVTPYFRASIPSLEVHDGDGALELSLLATGELDLRRARDEGRGWLGDRFAYTHGYGVQAVSASQIGPAGDPVRKAAPLRQPRIYFGLQRATAPKWVVANTRRPEVDGHSEVSGQGTSGYHYDGTGGIALSHWVRRAAFAIRLHNLQLLLTDDITPASRLIIQGDVSSRLKTVAGFVRWDPQLTTAITGGRVVFVAAGYTTSTQFPQAEAVGLAGHIVNYARASVWATVDAFSGETRLYLARDPDPIARAWAAAFPSLFRPMSQLPDALGRQLRYPPALFDAQATLYEHYHATDPNAFATGSDSWARPTSLSGPSSHAGDIRFRAPLPDPRNALRPAYRLSDSGHHPWNRLVRTTLYTPLAGQNLLGELNGTTDALGHLALSLIMLRRAPPTLGPSQISRLMILDPQVSDLLAVTNRETRDLGKASLAEVVLGRPKWLLLRGTACQEQAIYLQASASGVTHVLGVAVFVNGRVGIGGTLPQAVGRALTAE